MADELPKLAPPAVAGFYGRLADAVDKQKGTLKVSLAALLMRHWLENRDSSSIFTFDAPKHLREHADVRETLSYHRRVYLTEEQAHLDRGGKRWAGIVPRLQGKPPYTPWDCLGPLSLDYQSLVELPLRYQVTGNDADRDILYALHGFQLKTYVVVMGTARQSSSNVGISFQRLNAKRLEDAGLAAPYNLRTARWTVQDDQLMAAAEVDRSRKL